MRFRHAGGFLLLTALLLAVGCGDQNEAEVSGAVTVDGVPMASGAIQFVPEDGQSKTTGGAIKDGRYSVKVPVGRMKVSISMPKESRKKKLYNTPDSPVGTMYDEGLPAKYNEKSELTLEVKPGRNPKDWELQGKK
jgi:hypothetical protein